MVIALLLTATTSFAEERSSDAEHLLYLADHGLAAVRLRVEVDGKSQREQCREWIAAMCRQTDRDQDGSLTAEEFDAGVAVMLTRQTTQPQTPNRKGNTERPDFAGGQLPIDMVANILLKNLAAPLRSEFVSQRMRRINEAGELLDRPAADTRLFELLDADGNRKLTARELERATSVLAKLDFDEDETLTLGELQLETTAANARPMNPNMASRKSDGHLSLLSQQAIDTPFVRKVMSLYDGNVKESSKDQRLDRAETGLPESVFSQADADEDGYWDFDELRRFLERPVPSAEILVRLTTDGTPAQAEFTAVENAAVRLIHQQQGLVHIEILGVRFQLLLPPPAPEQQEFEKSLTLQFQLLDADKNEYLDPKEFPPDANDADSADENGKVDPNFVVIDTNKNGQISLSEFVTYHQLLQQKRDQRLVLQVDNLGRTLFGPLDVNGDGRLSQRELAQVKARLPEWDADGDGKLLESEIPQQYRLRLSRGDGLFGGNGTLVGTVILDAESGEAVSPPSPTTGPLWFRKMDRNRDGEVSPREFLGPAALFEKIDANGDGAIDAGEAATVK